MTDESSDYELPIEEFTVPELRIGIALQRKEIDRLKARVEELETRSAGTWVPVTERLPPGTDDYAVRIVGREEYDYVLVLVQSVLGGKPFVAAGAYHLGEWHCNGPDVVDVTHWLDVKLPGGE